MALPISSGWAGHIVAFEGPAELVSTQLRLLPTSHQILILPSLQQYLRDANVGAPFDTRELIHQYHTAAQTRHAEALEFLRPPTSDNEKRLVFMHGGTMSAHVSCLSTIMEHETDGNVEEAHATFIRLASNGVAGLRSARLSSHQVSGSFLRSTAEHEGPKLAPPDGKQGRQDVCEGSMNGRAGTIEDRIIRAMRAADALDRETEFLQPGTPDVDLTVKLVDVPSRSKKRLSSTAAEGPEIPRGSRPPSPPDDRARLSAEAIPRVLLDASSAKETASAAPRKPPLRIRIPSPPIPWAGDAAAAGDSHLPEVFQPEGPGLEGPRRRGSHTIESDLSPRHISMSGDNPRDNSEVPGPGSQGQPLPHEDTGNPTYSGASQSSEVEEQPFESVLPLLEHLVVLFTPETPDELHNFVFRRLSERCETPRPSIPSPSTPQQDASQGLKHPATRGGHEDDLGQSEDGHVGTVTPWMQKDMVHGLPTPNHSPNPLATESVAMPPIDTRLYSISVGQETAVSIQNFLRSFLASRFQLQDRRFSAPDGTEFSPGAGLWRAFECDGQVTSPVGESRLDLILAVGAESGVTKSRLSEVVGQLEKLGFKTSGLSRSGRLDIRSLIANAMQAFTAQPLTKQTQSNPFADRAVLAALIIPHLETYLATHPEVRFLLIEYPSEHLPTILALQTLIGTEMMKVVGIIDSDASRPSQSLSIPDSDRRPSEGFRSLNPRGSRTSDAFVGPCSFSKGNFLLASSATGFETAAFVAAIRESLISISDYYIPERPLYKHPAVQSPLRNAYPSLDINTKMAKTTPIPSQKEACRISVSTLIITPPSSPTEPGPPAHTQTPPHHHIDPPGIPPRSSSTFFSSPSPPSRGPQPAYNPNTTGTKNTLSTSGIRWGEVNYAPPTTAANATGGTTTITDTARTGSSNRHRHRHKDSDPLSPRDSAPPLSSSSVAAAAAAAKPVDDGDDSDDDLQDAEERRLMPMYLRRREEIEKGRSTKALKWLGLV